MGICRNYFNVGFDLINHPVVWKNINCCGLVTGTIYLLGKLCFGIKLQHMETELKLYFIPERRITDQLFFKRGKPFFKPFYFCWPKVIKKEC